MIIPVTSQKRQNRTVVLHLGNTLTEYKAWLTTEEHKDDYTESAQCMVDYDQNTTRKEPKEDERRSGTIHAVSATAI